MLLIISVCSINKIKYQMNSKEYVLVIITVEFYESYVNLSVTYGICIQSCNNINYQDLIFEIQY